ncbi:hypothetical protein HK103_005785 [Boothiomyces macroporosus]|uniref:Uncharacterized protein n=1 Tax=Boothiomyces macroporosus TaxID=261099 RepID=A0AAD5Y319_9FUNG|nr:hypothetical protein HK103_005785 [Boothiomyces macroporosus]
MRLDAKPLILSAVPSCTRYTQDDKDKLINVKINPAVPSKSLKLSNQIESKSWSPSLEPKQWHSDTWPAEKKWLKRETSWRSSSGEQWNPRESQSFKSEDKRPPQLAPLKIESETANETIKNEKSDKDAAVEEIVQLINLIDLNQSCQVQVEKEVPTIAELLNEPQTNIHAMVKNGNANQMLNTQEACQSPNVQPLSKISEKQPKTAMTDSKILSNISTVHKPTLKHKTSIAESIIQSINSLDVEELETPMAAASPSASQEILKSLTIDDDEGFSNISQSDYIQDDFELVQEEADWDIVSV